MAASTKAAAPHQRGSSGDYGPTARFRGSLGQPLAPKAADRREEPKLSDSVPQNLGSHVLTVTLTRPVFRSADCEQYSGCGRRLLVVFKRMKRDVLKIGVSKSQRFKFLGVAIFINSD